MSAPTALYRRYRPDSFAAVIGQEHVTAPLMAALEKNRVNHAYLFSGPRGCGKTTSARILARCLNCAKGPTSHPCGECESCIELARGGAGSLDVIEIDAASHGGVDDARDLRERATFAPIRDRYKIFIIDEAHMVTSAGFNALLKIVEEPPEHIKFIFATTEPDKVIGTIRSRTHHYPFRLVPPEPLMAYLAQLCEAENVAVAPGVLSLVVRAGGGSVRDSLSVLDQLMAGAGASGLDYDLAVDLLGYTHSSLLDDVVEALAASDSATVFKSVDRVIQTGHDPRRFVEDLLERFRDLIIVQAMPESAHAILRGTPDELIARMQTQAAQLGAAELSRAADITNAAFNEMTGATSPRLHLELLGARLLLPGADASSRGMATRLDQLERRLNYAGSPSEAAGGVPSGLPSGSPEHISPAPSTTPGTPNVAPGTFGGAPESDAAGGGLAAVRAQLARAKEAAGAAVTARHTPGGSNPPSSADAQAPTIQAATPAPAVQAPAAEVASAPLAAPAPAAPNAGPVPNAAPAPNAQAGQPTAATGRTWDDLPTPSGNPHAGQSAAGQFQQAPDRQQPVPAQLPVQQAPAEERPVPQPQQAPAPAAAPPSSSSGIEVIRRAWPEILGSLRNIRMASWVIVNQNVVPQTFDGQELRVGLPSSGLISAFSNGGHLQNLQQAINEVLGLSIQILPVDGEAPKASAEPNPKAPTGNPSPQREGNVSGAAQQPVADPHAAAAAVATPTQTAYSATPVAVPATAQVAAPASAVQWEPSPVLAQAQPRENSGRMPEDIPARSQAPSAGWETAPAAQQQTAAPAPPAPGTQQWGAPADSAPAPAAAPAATISTAPMATIPKVSSQSPVPPLQDPWDGPVEPSEPWDEPHPDSYPSEDPYADIPPAPEFAQAQPHVQAHPLQDQGFAPEPSAPIVHTPPKVSPIAAWTTGWDTPAEVPSATVVPTISEAPRRSELLAQQIAAQGTQAGNQDSPQDWGVSLGQGNRNNVADPGWGSMSNAPDWAQNSPAGTTSDDGAARTAAPPAPGSSAATPTEAEAPVLGETPFNAALPVAGQPLGASAAYPTPAAMPAPATSPAQPTAGPAQPASQASAPAQEVPAPNPAQAGERLSMYQRLANSSEAQAGRTQAPAVAAATPYVEDIPSEDDVTIEESGVVGQAAVERILGGVLVEERSYNSNS